MHGGEDRIHVGQAEEIRKDPSHETTSCIIYLIFNLWLGSGVVRRAQHHIQNLRIMWCLPVAEPAFIPFCHHHILHHPSQKTKMETGDKENKNWKTEGEKPNINGCVYTLGRQTNGLQKKFKIKKKRKKRTQKKQANCFVTWKTLF